MTKQERDDKRDELARHLVQTAAFHFAMGYTHEKAFKDGFDAATAIAETESEALRVAVDALQFYAQPKNYGRGESISLKDISREALATISKLMGKNEI